METRKLVDVVVEHGEVHGAPDHTVGIFENDEGERIRGNSRSFTIGVDGPVDETMRLHLPSQRPNFLNRFFNLFRQ